MKKMPIIYCRWLIMVSLCRLIGKSGICQLTHTNKQKAIRELVSRASQFSNMPWTDEFLHEVLRKEAIQSTGFGKGVAVAHGTCKGIEEVSVAVGISREGIDFNAIDSLPVHLLFLVANPPETQLDYLSALSTLVRLLRDKNFRQSILACTNTAEVYFLFEQLGCVIPIEVA
jgi:PTS system nitrogen regulatory IIA component